MIGRRVPLARWHRFLVGVLALVAVLMVPADRVAAQSGFAGRWVATFEGVPEAAIGGDGGVVYDFTFDPAGTVLVKRSKGYRFDKETVRYVVGADGGLTLSGSEKMSELNGATLTKLTNRKYEVTLGQVQTTMRPFSLKVAWLHGLFMFFLFIALNELCRYSKVAAIVMFFVLPFAMIPIWLDAGFDHWFRWVKLYSAVAGAIFITLMRFTNVWKKRWARITIAAILAINIAEAVKQDFNTWMDVGSTPNGINAIAGVLNIITISHWLTMHRDPKSPHDLVWPGMTKAWIIAYDIWNIAFVYMNFPNTVWNTVLIIIAPTLTAFYIKEGTWFQARAYTLSFFFMYLFTFRTIANNVLQMQVSIPLWRSTEIIWGLAIFSLAFNIWYAFMYFRARRTGKGPSWVEVGQNESATGVPIPPETRLAAA